MSRTIAIISAIAAGLLGLATTLWTLFGPTYEYARFSPVMAPTGGNSGVVERGTASLVEMGLSGTAAFFISVLSGASLVGLIGAWLVQKGRAPIAAPATAVAAGILWGGSLISLWGIGLLYLPTAALLSVASLTTWRAALRRPTRGALLILLTLLGTLIVLSLIISLLR